MLFITSFALSLLTLTAGLFLLIKSKQDPGKFLRIMSWIIISLGILAVLMSVHMAMYKHMMHKHDKSGMMEHSMFFHHRSPMGGFERMDMMPGMPPCDKGDGMKCCSEEKKACDTKCCNPDMQSKAIMKIITDNVKLTPDQEKTITAAIMQSMKACCSADKDKACCTKEKDKDGKDGKETK
jgi:hypothetical protein